MTEYGFRSFVTLRGQGELARIHERAKEAYVRTVRGTLPPCPHVRRVVQGSVPEFCCTLGLELPQRWDEQARLFSAEDSHPELVSAGL
jgi:hypothetical protein